MNSTRNVIVKRTIPTNYVRRFVGSKPTSTRMYSTQLLEDASAFNGRATLIRRLNRTVNPLQTNYLLPTSQSARTVVVVTTTTKADEIPQHVTTTTTNSKQQQLSDIQIDTSSSSDETQLKITKSCWERIHQLSKKRNKSLDELYLRVFVDAGGCSGFKYEFEFDTEPVDAEEDIVFNDTNSAARVVVDKTSYDFLKGSTLNYVQEMIKSNFEIQSNPQSEHACGCGSSFALKNFSKSPALD